MRQIIFEKNNFYKKATDILVRSVKRILSEKDVVIIGLPGGRNISGLIELLKKEKLPWGKVHVFMVDERLVPITDDNSNFKLIRILDEVIPRENLHPFEIDISSKDLGLSVYENEIKKYGGSYDIVVVSAGEDGHIAALYPNHHSLRNESKYYMLMHDSPKPPKDRMSMTKKMLLRTKIGLLMFHGEIKKDAYSKFLNKKIDFVNCPAKIISGLPEPYILTDIEVI